MVMTRISAPAAEPVTLAEAKAHLRVVDAVEDTLISGLIKAAREEVEAATGLALISQNWRLYLDCWPPSGLVRPNSRWLFRCRPAISVTFLQAMSHRAWGCRWHG